MRRRCVAFSVATRVGHRVRPTMCVAGALRSASLSASAAPGGVRPTACVASALLPASLPTSAAVCDQQRASPVRCVLHRYGRLHRRLLGVAGHHRRPLQIRRLGVRVSLLLFGAPAPPLKRKRLDLGNIMFSSQFARVVKGADLRSSAGNCAWAQTPQLTSDPVAIVGPPLCERPDVSQHHAT